MHYFAEVWTWIKKAVSVNPQWIRLPKSLSPGEVEANLRSDDSLDVFFSDSNRRIAVEIKGTSAPVGEVIRGLELTQFASRAAALGARLGVRPATTEVG